MIRWLLATLLSFGAAGVDVRSGMPADQTLLHGAQSQDQTGSVTGKIELRGGSQLIKRERGGRYQSVGSMSGMDERLVKPSEARNVVVYLEGGSESARSQASPHGVVDQQQEAFIPHVLAVQKGTIIDFVNHDKTYHNVFSLSPTKKFNIGRRPTGEKVPVLFDKPGIVQVFCDIHSQMTAFVVVLDNSLFVQPDDDGSFRIDHVPPGNYVLKVWHERLAAPDQKIAITVGGITRASFVLE